MTRFQGSVQRYQRYQKTRCLRDLADGLNKLATWLTFREQHQDWHEVSLRETAQGQDWNAITAWVLEQFGAPGERYVLHSDTEGMSFLFRDQKDAVWMALKYPA